MKHQIKIICGALTVLALVTGSAWATVTQDTEFNNERADMPQGLWEAFAKARLLIEPARDTTTGARFTGQNPGNKLRFEFNENGVIFKPSQRAGDWSLGMQLESYGNAEAHTTRKLHLDGNTVTLDRGDIQEWYINRPNGLEQGFTLATPPRGYETGQDIALAIQLTGNLEPKWQSNGQSIAFYTGKGSYVFSYDKLLVVDANGKTIPAQMMLAQNQMQLSFDPAGATWPVIVDPVVSTETRLMAEEDDSAALDFFGISVDLDGDTAVIGASADDDGGSSSGSAFVFVRTHLTWSLQAKLTASDAGAYDYFGQSVAVSGDRVLIGAPGDEEGGTHTGKAYVFVRDGGQWSQEKVLHAGIDATIDDSFGYSVALDGATALVGAILDDGVYEVSGSAYVFFLSKGSWALQQKLIASNDRSDDRFGYSVSLSNDTALIGAPYADDVGGGLANNGAAYVFTRVSGNWSEQQILVAGDAGTGDLLGISAALYDDTAVLGARGDGSDSGSAYVFSRSGSTWSQPIKLTADDAATGDYFGNTVALFYRTILVGAERDNDDGSHSGSVYVFTQGLLNKWSQTEKITAGDAAADDQFGKSVALSGNTALIGATGDDDGGASAGSAYVYVADGSNWLQQQKLTAVNFDDLSYYGSVVALSKDTAFVGAPSHDVNGLAGEDWGAVFVFMRSGGSWVQTQILSASEGVNGAAFGSSVALSGDTALIGAPFDDDGVRSGVGAVYVFTRLGNTWSQQQKIIERDFALNRFGNSVALSDSTALIGAPYDDEVGLESGAAYIYVFNGINWTLQQKLTVDYEFNSLDHFGLSVALEGNTALIGSYGGKDPAPAIGAVYVFTRFENSWTQQAQLNSNLADQWGGDHYFGFSVALSGDTALIGAPLARTKSDEEGVAFVFKRSGSTWSEQAVLTPDADSRPFTNFGIRVALSDDIALIGTSPNLSPNPGEAYVFTRSGNSWFRQRKLFSSSPEDDGHFGSNVALYGDTAIIGAWGENCSLISCGAVYVHQFVCGFGSHLLANRWTMIGIPCSTGAASSVEDIFGDNLNLDSYYSRWVVYERDELTDEYNMLNPASQMVLGKGYWILSLDSTVWDVDGVETPRTTSEPNCPWPGGCYVLDLVPPGPGQPPHFNMIGHVFSFGVDWEDVRIDVDGEVLTPSDAETAGYIDKEIWTYNGNGYDVFDDVTPGMEGTLKSQEGVWIAVLNGAAGRQVKLLVPVSNTIEAPPLPPTP